MPGEKYLKADDSERDVNKLAREELARLQRQYRLIEDQRHGYKHDSGYAAQRQNLMLGLLNAEKKDLETDLKIATCPQYQEKAKEGERLILEILDRYDNYQREIKQQIKAIEEMELQVDKIADKVVKQRLKILALYGLSSTPAEADKKLRILEDRLYHFRTLFDEKCTENVKLREGINEFLRSRGRFHKRYNYLKKEIQSVKNQMLHVVHQASQTYDTRDESVGKSKVIREREHKESKQHVMEIKEFQRVLHHDHKIHEFLKVKNNERTVIEDAEQRTRRKENQKEAEIDETLKRYRQSVKRILKFADFQSVDHLCEFYEDLEQKNFSKFKYITDLNHECDVLKEAINLIKKDIDVTHKVTRERQLKQHQMLKEKQDSVHAAKEELIALENERDVILGTLGKLVHGVALAFDLAECSNSSILRVLGNGSGVSLRNVLLCINILDHQITNLTREKATLEARKAIELQGQSLLSFKSGAAFTKTKPISHGGPFRAEVNIPNHLGNNAEEEDDKEMYAKPYYFNEMREYVHAQMVEDGLIKEGLSMISQSGSSRMVTATPSELSLKEKMDLKKNARMKSQQNKDSEERRRSKGGKEKEKEKDRKEGRKSKHRRSQGRKDIKESDAVYGE